MRRQFEVIDELDELEFDEGDEDHDEDMTCQVGTTDRFDLRLSP